jgi:hypothetical protein
MCSGGCSFVCLISEERNVQLRLAIFLAKCFSNTCWRKSLLSICLFVSGLPCGRVNVFRQSGHLANRGIPADPPVISGLIVSSDIKSSSGQMMYAVPPLSFPPVALTMPCDCRQFGHRRPLGCIRALTMKIFRHSGFGQVTAILLPAQSSSKRLGSIFLCIRANTGLFLGGAGELITKPHSPLALSEPKCSKMPSMRNTPSNGAREKQAYSATLFT